MPATRSLSRGAKYLLLALPLFLIFAYINTKDHARFFARPARPAAPASSDRRPENHDQTDWWLEFFTRLQATRVDLPPTVVDGMARGDNWRPDIDYARPELIKLTATAEAKFRRSHADFVQQLPEFARHLPYDADTTGIVTTAGATSFGQAVSLVLLTRQSGSRLPIQIVLDSSAAWVDFLCAHEMPRHNATCVRIGDLWAELPRVLTAQFERFQWKAIALLASTFQNVLFLDADCFPALNPDPIFDKGAEPFTSTGFITWPDFWTPSASSVFYKIAGDVEVPPLTARATSESGVMVYDKARHADTLLLAAYYNYNGPAHFYTMLTQRAPGEGDKETFLQAALVLDALQRRGVYRPPTGWMRPGVGVRKGYWDVKTMPNVHGRTAREKKWRGMFMQQMDPMEDYRAVMAAVEEDKAKEKTKIKADKPSHKTTQQHPRQRRGSPLPQSTTDSNPRDHEDATTSAYLTDSSSLATTGNLTMTPNHARYMFYHHNGIKPDFTRILDPASDIVAVGDTGRPIRMWGDPGWIVERTGRDVEKLWWEASVRVYCQPGMEQWGAVCAEMRRVYGAVYL
jgi:alpha 1,2-mannosyltransferase